MCTCVTQILKLSHIEHSWYLNMYNWINKFMQQYSALYYSHLCIYPPRPYKRIETTIK
jgi:hypothetical protein